MLLCLTRSDGPWANIKCPFLPILCADEDSGLGDGSITLGRKPGAGGVALDDASVRGLLSRQHCKLRSAGGLLEVTDLNSVNGTFHAAPDDDGSHLQQLQPHTPHILQPGSTLLLGGRETVLGQHGQVVSNPFVFLVCQAASDEQALDAGHTAAAAAAAAKARGGHHAQERAVSAACGGGSNGAMTLLQCQHQQCCDGQQQQLHAAELHPVHLQQHQQHPPLADCGPVLQQQQQQQSANDTHRGPQHEVLQDLLGSACHQHNMQDEQAPSQNQCHVSAAQQVQSSVVGISEPAAKRYRRSSSVPPPVKQSNWQQQQRPAVSHTHSQPLPQEQLAAVHVGPAAAAPAAAAAAVPAGSLQHQSAIAGGAVLGVADVEEIGAVDAPEAATHAQPDDEAVSLAGQQYPAQAPTASAAARLPSPQQSLPRAAAALRQQHNSKVSRDVRQVSASHLDCAICRGLLVATHTLLCGHMFCGPCLAQWLEVQARPSCPSCRAAVESVPVRMYRFDELVAEAAASSGSEPQDCAARLALWAAIKDDTTDRWHSMFSSSNAAVGRGAAAAAADEPPGAGGRRRRAAQTRQVADAVHLGRGDVHLLTGLTRLPVQPAAAAAAAAASNTAARAVPRQAAAAAGTHPRQHSNRRGRRRTGRTQQQQQQQQSADYLMQEWLLVAATASRNPTSGLGQASGHQQGRQNAAPARHLRQTAIDGFIQ